MNDGLHISAWYGGGRTRATMVRSPGPGDSARWRRDLEAIASTGLRAIKCWVDWASVEPEPGAFVVRNLDLLLELAEEVGLGVYVQVYLDSAPDWLGRAYPDARYVSDGGTPIDSQGSPGCCYDHPAVRAGAERVLERLAAHLAPRKAFRGWDLWSEPHVVQWSYFDFLVEPSSFCFCVHTRARFRAWLRTRYDSLETLNALWYRTFGSWDEVEPARFTTLMTSVPSFDWQHFLMDKLAEDLRWRHEAVRRADDHVTSSHSAIPSLMTLPTGGHGSPDDWRMPSSVDVYGTSLYPKHVGAAETNDPAFRSALLAGAYSACGPFWLGELQGGHGYVGTFAAPVSAQDIRAYAWQCIAHGAKGLHFYAWYPMTTGIESGGFGLAELNGEPSARAYAAGEVARVTATHAALFADARPEPARAAILWDLHANTLWAAMRESWHYVPSRSYVGAYRSLYRRGLAAEYLHPDRLADGIPARIRLLCLPFALALTQTAADAIEAYVARGGIVVAEARTGWTDETGQSGDAIPALGLDRLFGAREEDAERVGTPGSTVAPVPLRIVRDHPLLPELRAGDPLFGGLFRQRLWAYDGTDVLATFDDGTPAITARRHGEGWAVLVGSLVSLAVHAFRDGDCGRDKGADRFLGGLARAAGIEPAVTVRLEPDARPGTGRAFEARVLRTDPAADNLLLIGCDHGANPTNPASVTSPTSVTFDLERPDHLGPTVRVHDLLNDTEIPVAQKGDRLLVPYRPNASGVAVLHITGGDT